MTLPPLPIDRHLPEVAATLRQHGALVLVAPPGAGKTTRVPPALLADGPVIVLQPRRVAARALARRIAAEQGVEIGAEVGWQVRFERRFSARTRLLIATEGVLTARLQSDPLLSEFATVVLDEFHERSLHADLALALVRQARAARGELRILVMSATLEAEPVARFLGGCPLIEVAGRPFPVEIEYAPGLSAADGVRRQIATARGDLLAFLPGAREIRDAESSLRGALGDVDVLPLHGSLDGDQQDRALLPTSRRRVILATNLAETSLTVEGVSDVIDTGLHKLNRYEPSKGLDRLNLERIAEDSATQRAGRAGRTGPGRTLRLWDPRERLAPRRVPEIARVDLAAPFLDVIAWGGDPLTFEWFEAPPEPVARAALALLTRLGAIDERRHMTALGEELRRWPLHPRLARVLQAAGGSFEAAAVCALLSDRPPGPQGPVQATDCDLFALLERLPPAVREAARELLRRSPASARAARPVPGAALDELGLRKALWLGYPDRVAQRRRPGEPQLLLASGHGASLARESGVVGAAYLIALDLTASERQGKDEVLVRLASAVEPEWLEPTSRERVQRLDDEGRVRTVECERYDALVLRERPVEGEPGAAASLLTEAWKRRGPSPNDTRFLRRLAFAGLEHAVDDLVQLAVAGRDRLSEIDLAAAAPFALTRDLGRLAPDRLAVPSGRSMEIEYREDGSAQVSVKLQELFGLAETPLLGPRRTPVTLELLAPNGRPVQTTRDLRSFWDRTYPEVRKELRGRYPRHPWPEDPWSATPTHRAKRRGQPS